MGGAYPWRAMVSSTMRDLKPEREATVAEVQLAGLEPLWAEGNPVELDRRPRAFCQEMAETCDLYLMIVGPNYGYTPEGHPADNGRSVTELELDWATTANLRKVMIFVRADAFETPDAQQRALVDRIRNFERGYVTYPPFTTTTELAQQVRQALTDWLEAHEGGRSAWLKDIVRRYATLHNIVTLQDMPIGETTLLQLRSEEVDRLERRTWDSAESLDDSGPHEHRGATAAQRVSAFLPGMVNDARQRAVEHEARPPIIRSAQEFLDQFQRLVVVGDPGAGKSTLLRRQAHDSAAQAIRQSVRAAPRPLIPIYVTVPTLANALAERANEQRNSATAVNPLAVLAETVARLAVAGMADAVALDARLVLVDAITQNEALLLVDGLDEVDASQRELLLTALEALGGNRAMLALRPSALQRAAPQRWRICDIQQLDAARREELIARTLESMGTSVRSEVNGKGLDAALKHHSDLTAWSGSPLLLTLLAVQYGRTGKLPERRAQLYAYAVNELIDRRGRAAMSALTPDELHSSLERLALRMMRERVVTVSAEQLRSWAARDNQPLAEDVAQDLLARADLLQQQSPGQWGFVHLTFQEYLAALALVGMLSHARRKEARQEILRRRFSAWWEQVYYLLLSELDSPPHPQPRIADDVIRWLISVDGKRLKALGTHDPTHTALQLATWLFFSRQAANRSVKIRRMLARRWQPLWDREVWRSATGSALRALGSV